MSFYIFHLFVKKDMPKTARTHSESLKAACTICFCKSGDLRDISKGIQEIIKAHIFPNFNAMDEIYPSVICSSCRKKVSASDFENLPIFDREKIRVPSRTRQNLVNCNCSICEIARMSINAKTPCRKSSPGRPSSSSTVRHDDKLSPSSLKVCAYCFCKLGRGKSHACSKNDKFANLTDLLSSAVSYTHLTLPTILLV